MKIFKTLGCAVLSLLLVAQVQAANISQDKLQKLLKDDNKPLLIDVRSAQEFANGHIPGAINIPHKSIKNQMALLEMAKGKQIVLYCHSGTRANFAKKVLKKNGFSKLDHLAGDYRAWSKKGLPVEKTEDAGKTGKKLSNPCAL